MKFGSKVRKFLCLYTVNMKEGNATFLLDKFVSLPLANEASDILYFSGHKVQDHESYNLIGYLHFHTAVLIRKKNLQCCNTLTCFESSSSHWALVIMFIDAHL